MCEIWGIPPFTNRGPKTIFCRRVRNLTATLTEYIFEMKHDNQASALATRRGPTPFQNAMKLGPQTS